MPCGLFGDLFYCTSDTSESMLQNIYQGNCQKFIFDQNVARYMFGVGDSDDTNSEPRIVFFPESREIEVNKKILETLIELDVVIFLKLHPSDQYSNYSSFVNEDCVINDLEEALTGTICLARRSTVLLESLYRGGYPCALLFNQKDRVYVEQVFPSLSNPKIASAYNLEDLKKFIRGV